MQMLVSLARAAAVRCKERHDALATEVLSLQEGIDDVGFNILPNRESEKNHIILRQVFHLTFDARTAVWMNLHLLVHARVILGPIDIVFGVRLSCLNFENICTCVSGDFLCVAFVVPE